MSHPAAQRVTDTECRQELINRVSELITAERKRLERQRYEEERQQAGEAAQGAAASNGGSTPTEEGENGSSSTETKPAIPTGPMPDIERGLCVVCQDEEATLAVVDCGHLCMCARKFTCSCHPGTEIARLTRTDCSDLIMATSRECPLCRTRIVTESVMEPACLGQYGGIADILQTATHPHFQGLDGASAGTIVATVAYSMST